MCKVHLSLALDRRLYNAEDKRFNVKVIVYFNPDGKQNRRRCNTLCYLTEEEFKKLHANGQKSDYVAEMRIKIDKYYAEIQSIVDKLGDDFSFEKFDALFQHRGLSVSRGRPSLRPKKAKQLLDENISYTDVFTYFKDYIFELRGMNRIGTAESYKTAMKALYSFKPDLMFSDITPSFLYSFEEHMLNKGRSISTVGIYTRTLRAIINTAIDDKSFPADSYPFGLRRRRKYQIPSTKNIKKALDVEDIRKIKSLEITKKNTEFARDIWMFSFYCNGMNMADIFYLKYQDISDDYLRFVRRKTLNTQREQQPIEIFLSEPAKEIINKWGNKDISPTTYVFSGVDSVIDSKRLHELKCNFTRNVNYQMKKIALQLGIDKPLTTNAARHSFATTLKNLDVPLEQIAECLGHSDIKTTRFYLDSFSDDHKVKTSKLLEYAI